MQAFWRTSFKQRPPCTIATLPKLHIGKSTPVSVQEILKKRLLAKQQDGYWNFEDAKTLVMFCNGPWCGQSPTNIKDLLKIG